MAISRFSRDCEFYGGERERELEDTISFAWNYFADDYPKGLNPLQQEIGGLPFNLSESYMVMAPIGFGKTTTILIKIIKEICRNRNIRILYGARTYSLAKKKVAWIASQLRFNKKLIARFGEFYDRNNPWSTEGFTVSGRSYSRVDPTLQAAGLHQAIEGGRYDLGVADDIVDIASFTSETERENAWNWYNLTFRGRIDPPKPVWIIGGRWHGQDIYQQIMDAGNIPYKIYTCWRDEEKGISWWPDEYTYELLMSEKESNPLYALKYLNDPQAALGGEIGPDDIQYYTELPQNLSVFQGWDLAISEKERADYTVGLTGGIDRDNNIYVLDIYREHIGFPDQYRMVVQKGTTYRPIKIGIESNAYQKSLPQLATKTTLLPIEGQSVSGEKYMRLRGLSAYFRQKKVFLRRDMQDFVMEALAFPGGKHDDQLDAFWHMIRAAGYGGQYGAVGIDMRKLGLG